MKILFSILLFIVPFQARAWTLSAGNNGSIQVTNTHNKIEYGLEVLNLGENTSRIDSFQLKAGKSVDNYSILFGLGFKNYSKTVTGPYEVLAPNGVEYKNGPHEETFNDGIYSIELGYNFKRIRPSIEFNNYSTVLKIGFEF